MVFKHLKFTSGQNLSKVFFSSSFLFLQWLLMVTDTISSTPKTKTT